MRGDSLGNTVRAEEFEAHRQINKIGTPVDRGEFGMSPPTVNAYYNPEMNEMVFPAGILQPPFFNAAAVNTPAGGGSGTRRLARPAGDLKRRCR